MLDLVAQVLRQNQYEYSRIDGQSSLSARNSAMLRFNENPRCTVMLASIGSAAEGCASSFLILLEMVAADGIVLGLISPQRATLIC